MLESLLSPVLPYYLRLFRESVATTVLVIPATFPAGDTLLLSDTTKAAVPPIVPLVHHDNLLHIEPAVLLQTNVYLNGTLTGSLQGTLKVPISFFLGFRV